METNKYSLSSENCEFLEQSLQQVGDQAVSGAVSVEIVEWCK